MLDLICNSRRAPKFTEIVREVGLPKSSVHRVLSILTAESLIEHELESGTYRPGRRLIDWSVSTLTHNDLPTLANPMMEQLSKGTGNHVSLAVLNGTNALFIASVDPAIPYRLSPRVGEQSPAHCCAVGKILLSQIRPHRLSAYLDRMPLEKFTEHTITNRENLTHELDMIKAKGFAECDREEFLQISGIAVPIYNFNGICVAAVSIWNETTKRGIDGLRGQYASLRDHADAISKRLGHEKQLPG